MIRPGWLIAVFIATVLAPPSASGQGSPLQRKNIDLLTPGELAAYEHAFQILRDRSTADPYDRSGFYWQAWVHNCYLIVEPKDGGAAVPPHTNACDQDVSFDPAFTNTHPGNCEHGKDLFLPWHRAHLYYFERILQNTDPDGTATDSRGKTGPSTRDVTVPYWNWTRPPTGQRYPRAFEVPNSPLYSPDRLRGPLTPTERRLLGKVTNPLAVAALVHLSDWNDFGGYPQESPLGGYGRLESAHHNPMHSSYFGGDMSNPGRAALDPGFYSFHAYIDLVWQFWLDEHGASAVTSLDHFLRGTQPDGVALVPGYTPGAGLPSMGQGKLYLDSVQSGYVYEVTPEDRLPSREAVLAALSSPSGEVVRFGSPGLSPFARVANDGLNDQTGQVAAVEELDITIPVDVAEVRVSLVRPPGAEDLSFEVDYYLHPAAEPFDLAAQTDRQRYIVDSLGYWGRGEDGAHEGHDPIKPLTVDLSNEMRDLAETGHAGEAWRLTAVISGPPPTASFGELSLRVR